MQMCTMCMRIQLIDINNYFLQIELLKAKKLFLRALIILLSLSIHLKMKYILNTDISSEEETAGSVIDKGDGESIIQDIIVDYSKKVLDVDLNSSST